MVHIKKIFKKKKGIDYVVEENITEEGINNFFF